ncbi:MAG: zinc ribbon domain-containing protein [Dehalococcoidales bacterium]|nr:zinc ribbon domain-containing protein [Dehalococcoidales bacterium]
MEEKTQSISYCQSCSMPLTDEKSLGTNADGSPNHDYCAYCYKDGKFTTDMTMDQMIEFCVPFVSKGNPWPDADAARKAMKEMFPGLKRWKQ